MEMKSKSREKLENYLKSLSYFNTIERSNVYATDFLVDLNRLKENKYESFDKVVIYLSALTKRDKNSGKQLVGFKNSSFDDPISCIDLETIENRLDQIPCDNIVLITELKELTN